MVLYMSNKAASFLSLLNPHKIFAPARQKKTISFFFPTSVLWKIAKETSTIANVKKKLGKNSMTGVDEQVENVSFLEEEEVLCSSEKVVS